MKELKKVKLKLDLADIENWNFDVPSKMLRAEVVGNCVDIEVDFQVFTDQMAKQCLEALTSAIYVKITADGVRMIGNKNCDTEDDEETYSVLIPWDEVHLDWGNFKKAERAITAWIKSEKAILEC